MNKLLISIFAALAFFQLSFAEGYQVNTLSAKQLGMGHTGVGLKLGAENMHFNPGGLGFLDKKIDLSAGLTAIFPEVEYSGAGKFYETDGSPSTPLYFYGAFGIYDWFKAGVSVTTPYGNAANWGEHWAGSDLVQEISLQVFSVQPTLAFKIFDKVSIGGGPTIYFGNFSLSRSLVGAGALNGLAGLAAFNPEITGIVEKYKDISAVSAKLSGDADVNVGYNVGILYDLLKDKLAIGVSYRSEVKMKVSEGKAKLSFASSDFQNDLDAINGTIKNANPILPSMGRDTVAYVGIPPLDAGTFEASLPMPATLSAGVSFKPIKDLILDFDLQWINWSAYDSLIVQFSQEVLGGYSVRAPKKYHNTFSYRFGAQYSLTDRFDIRGGAYYDESPVNGDYLNPETPSMDKLGLTTGFSFRPIPTLSIDAAFLYTLGFGRDGSYPSPSQSDPAKTFKGHYEVQAWSPSLGLSFAF